MNSLKWKIISKIAGALLVCFFIAGLVLIFSLRNNLLNNEQAALEELTLRAEHDLLYSAGNWNTTKYNADPNTPHPEGSSGFGSSLYIITSEGFVIERTQPINGLFDSADFKHLMSFQTPQTITIVTNEQWRVLSRPLVNEKGIITGVAMVAYLNPPSQLLQAIDEKLQRDVSYIVSSASVKNDSINVDNVDVRDIDYDVSFEIVNHFNRVLLNSGRVPTYIDSSYVEQELSNREGISQYTDKQNEKKYLLYRKHLLDTDKKPIGVILSAKSIDYINNLIRELILHGFLSGIITVILLTVLVYRSVASSSLMTKVNESTSEYTAFPETISFDPKKNILTLNSKSITVPYATNQYELAKAVFSAPAKRWELDELLEKFGETENLSNWRKVYDATLALNKRAELKIVVYKDKTFRLNPDLVPLIKKI